MGLKCLLLTMSLDQIAEMSCNPAIGGLAKGHMVREIDALGGEMAKVADKTGIQFRLLNTKKGPAVQAPRAQSDKKLYKQAMRRVLESQLNLDLKQGIAGEILVDSGRVRGIRCEDGREISSSAVILTTGTFLNGLILSGKSLIRQGRFGEAPAANLSNSLLSLGIEIKRLKTGTPQAKERIDRFL
jgi:tRNA uridine 5-carboxymethylaminomethyl modification enzyme